MLNDEASASTKTSSSRSARSKKRKAEDMQDTTIHFDNKGDLRLQVGTEERIFVVCSRTVSRASEAFERMLHGPYAERKPADPNIDWVVKLPEDSARGLEVVLNVIHARFKLIPESLGPDVLFHVIAVADKYDMIEALKPWCKQWLAPLEEPEPGSIPLSQALQLLWTAWRLGSRALYNSLAGDLVLRIESKRLILSAADFGDYYLSNHQFSKMEGFKLANSASLIDPIVKARLEILNSMVEEVLDLKGRLKNPQSSSCKSTNTNAMIDPNTCKRMLMGSVYMHEDDWYCFPPSGAGVNETIAEFQAVTMQKLIRTFTTLPGHKLCNPADELNQIIAKAKEKTKYYRFVDWSMDRYFRQQAEKLGL
ncbi:uncharacterized protein PgNI_03537 [Pyricularia grisea]|uniref:BTB domain-containing protein n=1 Tax=Pyricularia grisea TaxID=148305 RepID=A0A6P8BAT0_PYRGI|nr:uncharacterized protein PgNI_03537 [Pyricularia grisea]TLD12909.1 hypothetical protein PgNI_03537 [Pyricularia grisea]